MYCLCGNEFEFDYNFKNKYHIAHCLNCNKKIIDISYFKLIKKLQNINEESNILLNNHALEIKKQREIEISYRELINNERNFDDELCADFLESTWA